MGFGTGGSGWGGSGSSGGSGGGAGPGVCGKVAMATQSQTYYATPYGVACPYVPSITNLLLRRQAVQQALFTVSLGSAPNARGTAALDIQSTRASALEVASGANASCFGTSCRAAGTGSLGIGTNSVALTNYSVAIGYTCQALSYNAGVAMGRACITKGFVSAALGWGCQSYAAYGFTMGFKCRVYGSEGAPGNGQMQCAAGVYSFGYANACAAFGVMNNQTGGALNVTTGVITGVPVKNATVGINSTAVGVLNLSKGLRSTTVGFNNAVGTATLTGNSSSAVGYGNIIASTVNSNSAAAFGFSNTVNNDGAAFGKSNTITGSRGSAFGYNNTVNASRGSAFGDHNTVGSASYVAYRSSAFGSGCTIGSTANSGSSLACGYACTVNTSGANAIGYKSIARIPNTTVIQGPIIAPKTNGLAQAQAIKQLTGVQNVLYTVEIDFTAAGATYTITLPVGSRFLTDMVGVIVEELDGSLTTQISYEFGITGTNAKYLGVKAGAALGTLWNEEKWQNLLADQAESSLTFTITVSGVLNSATKYKGKAFWVGRLIETEP